MEKNGSVRNGGVRYPPGFRFSPTDEELVVHYLKRKVLSIPLPFPIIRDVDICKHDPWFLPGNLKQVRYFFTTREAKYPNGNRHNRATVSGYWKATGIDKQITTRDNRIVGMKKTLVFYHGKPPYGDRTGWIMHEYRLVSSEIATTQDSEVQMEDWVLCRIFEKKSINITGFEIAQPCNNKTRPTFIDFMKIDKTDLGASSSSASSGSSGTTEVSTNGSDHEEASGSNSFSPSS